MPCILVRAPNPFMPPRGIVYGLPPSDGAQPVSLKVYDPGGRLLRTLVDGVRTPGMYRLLWDGTDAEGREAPAGVFFIRLSVGGRRVTERGVIIR